MKRSTLLAVFPLSAPTAPRMYSFRIRASCVFRALPAQNAFWHVCSGSLPHIISAHSSIGIPLPCFTLTPRLNASALGKRSLSGPARSRYINVNRGTTKSRWMRHKVDDPEDAYWCKLSRRTLLVKIPRFYIPYVTIRIYLSQICIFFERYFAVNNSCLCKAFLAYRATFQPKVTRSKLRKMAIVSKHQ